MEKKSLCTIIKGIKNGISLNLVTGKFLFFPLLFTFFMLLVTTLYSQDVQEDKNIKKGWNFGALPTITYNTDLGFQYGALVNLFNYGDGTKYPKYLHNIYIEASRFTKGSAIYRVAYDSEFLIPGVRVTSDLAYLPDEAFDFYGFNGYESLFTNDWQNDQSAAYKTRMFYKYQNHMFRFKTDLQFPFSDKRFLALAGFNLQYFGVNTVDIDKMNKGKTEDLLPEVPTLYDEYVDWGIISNEEKDGGFIPLFKAGIIFDTRDNEPNPMKGMWSEAFLFGAPTFLGAESGFLKFNVTHRQYFTLVKRDLSLAYRIGYQGTLAGEVPFYYQSQIETSLMKDQLGLGGTKTIRGINRNSVIGNGFVYGNIELRWKVVHFRFINQNFYIGLNGFLDGGMITQKISIKEKIAQRSDIPQSQYFDFDAKETLHTSFGAGLRIVMNENFVISCDYGRAFNPQDGNSGLYIGLNYLF
jgi:hypothetical protein